MSHYRAEDTETGLLPGTKVIVPLANGDVVQYQSNEAWEACGSPRPAFFAGNMPTYLHFGFVWYLFHVQHASETKILSIDTVAAYLAQSIDDWMKVPDEHNDA